MGFKLFLFMKLMLYATLTIVFFLAASIYLIAWKLEPALIMAILMIIFKLLFEMELEK